MPNPHAAPTLPLTRTRSGQCSHRPAPPSHRTHLSRGRSSSSKAWRRARGALCRKEVESKGARTSVLQLWLRSPRRRLLSAPDHASQAAPSSEQPRPVSSWMGGRVRAYCGRPHTGHHISAWLLAEFRVYIGGAGSTRCPRLAATA